MKKEYAILPETEQLLAFIGRAGKTEEGDLERDLCLPIALVDAHNGSCPCDVFSFEKKKRRHTRIKGTRTYSGSAKASRSWLDLAMKPGSLLGSISFWESSASS